MYKRFFDAYYRGEVLVCVVNVVVVVVVLSVCA